MNIRVILLKRCSRDAGVSDFEETVQGGRPCHKKRFHKI